MEKLIKLLNEHRAELLHGNIQNKPMRHYSGYVFGLSDLTEQNCILLVISKEYGFIKWLVDNDKIDIDKYYEFMTNENIDISNACGELDMDKEFYYELLMILAVQDNPIKFLISILK